MHPLSKFARDWILESFYVTPSFYLRYEELKLPDFSKRKKSGSDSDSDDFEDVPEKEGRGMHNLVFQLFCCFFHSFISKLKSGVVTFLFFRLGIGF